MENGSQPLKSMTKVSNVFRPCVFPHETSQLSLFPCSKDAYDMGFEKWVITSLQAEAAQQ